MLSINAHLLKKQDKQSVLKKVKEFVKKPLKGDDQRGFFRTRRTRWSRPKARPGESATDVRSKGFLRALDLTRSTGLDL